jgi:CheY-like chemotaxis protein/HPt (histidine-containing phosphotransfer) domain-containing protein
VVAATGRDALALMDQLDFDLVLMDWQLPGMDGLETTRAWRAQEGAGKRLPIVAMTATATADAEAESRAAGMDGFLPKPVSLDGLAEVLGRFVASADGVSGLHGGPSPAGGGPRDKGPADITDELAVDEAVLDALVRELGDPAIAGRVVATYLDELDGRLASLRTSTANGDRETLQRIAHTLRSTSRALGADGLAQACAELEASAPDADTDPGPLVDDIMRIAGAVAAVMRIQLKELT